MDPISLIVAALVAGAAAGVQDTATDAVKSAYSTLKRMISNRTAGRSHDAVEVIEQDPSSATDALESVLRESRAEDDQDLLAAAAQLQTAVKAATGDMRVWDNKIENSKGVIVGNQGTVNMDLRGGA